MLGIQQACCNLKITMQHRPAAIASGMPQHRRRVTPVQPIVLKVQSPQHSRGGTKGIEGAKGVGDEMRIKFAITAYCAADVGLRFQQQRVPTRLSQPVGSHQSVGTGTDDNRIYFAWQRHALTSRDMTSKDRLTTCYSYSSS